MNDYQVICFNGANRTKDKETTDLTAIHPISKNCEEFVKSFCFKNNINFLGGVALAEGLLLKLTDALEKNNFIEEGTYFSDTHFARL
jgi:hypothetical protein